MKIRLERSEDISVVEVINTEAFSQPNEAKLVNKLRGTTAILSLVAEDSSGKVVGHIMFSRTPIVNEDGSEFPAISLAPMAVLKANQGKGVGGRLVKEGILMLRKMGEMIIVVLGHPWYYPKFGFELAEQYGIKPPFKINNPKAWMVCFLEEKLKGQVEGSVRYPEVFYDV